MYLVTADEMREMDHRTIASFGVPGRVLMENAGLGAANVMQAHFPGLESKKVGVLAGRGNNGGDGFVIARYLSFRGVEVTVFLFSKKGKVKGDAGANLALLEPLDIPVVEVEDSAALKKKKAAMRQQDVWVDALLGTGLNADVRGHYREAIEFINRRNQPVFSVDLPSGLNSDTGQVCGSCIRAQVTATFGFAKLGLKTFPGAALCGDLAIIDIGIPPYIAEAVNPRQFLLTGMALRAIVGNRAPPLRPAQGPLRLSSPVICPAISPRGFPETRYRIQDLPKLLQRTDESFAGCGRLDAQFLGSLSVGQLLEVTQRENLAIGRVHALDRLLNQQASLSASSRFAGTTWTPISKMYRSKNLFALSSALIPRRWKR